MFYSDQLLLGKKAPLGAVWIAAHGSRCLKRSNILGVDVVETCKQIMDPDIPQALRLQGILIGGIVVIFDRQQMYLLDDCNDVVRKVNMNNNSGPQQLLGKEKTRKKGAKAEGGAKAGLTKRNNAEADTLLQPDELPDWPPELSEGALQGLMMPQDDLLGDEALFVMPTQGDSGLNTSLADADSGSRQLHHLSSLSNPAFGPGLQLDQQETFEMADLDMPLLDHPLLSSDGSAMNASSEARRSGNISSDVKPLQPGATPSDPSRDRLSDVPEPQDWPMHQEDMGQLKPADLPPGSPFRGSDAAGQAEPEPSQPVAQRKRRVRKKPALARADKRVRHSMEVQPSQSSCPDLQIRRPALQLPGIDAPPPKPAVRLATFALHDLGSTLLHRVPIPAALTDLYEAAQARPAAPAPSPEPSAVQGATPGGLAGTGDQDPAPPPDDMGPMDLGPMDLDAGQHLDMPGQPDLLWDGNISLDNALGSNLGSQPGSSNPSSRRGSWGGQRQSSAPPDAAPFVPMFERLRAALDISPSTAAQATPSVSTNPSGDSGTGNRTMPSARRGSTGPHRQLRSPGLRLSDVAEGMEEEPPSNWDTVHGQLDDLLAPDQDLPGTEEAGKLTQFQREGGPLLEDSGQRLQPCPPMSQLTSSLPLQELLLLKFQQDEAAGLASEPVALFSMLSTLSRLEAAQIFYQSLALHTSGAVLLGQEDAYADILMHPPVHV